MNCKQAAVIFVLAMLAGCGRGEEQATVNQSTPAGVVLELATAYALANYESFVSNKDVQVNGVHLQPGSGLGETLSTTLAQLSAMGYARSNSLAGLITIDLLPKGCAGSDCAMTVTAIVQGEKRSSKFKLKSEETSLCLA